MNMPPWVNEISPTSFVRCSDLAAYNGVTEEDIKKACENGKLPPCHTMKPINKKKKAWANMSDFNPKLNTAQGWYAHELVTFFTNARIAQG